MADWVSTASGYLWQNGLAAVPLVLIVAVATRVLPCRPATRHMMWVMVLLWLIAPPIFQGLPNPWAHAADANDANPTAAIEAARFVDASPTNDTPGNAPLTNDAAENTPRQPVRVSPHVSNRRRPNEDLTEARTHLSRLPSPRRTARADDTDHSLLAQVCDAAGLPPRLNIQPTKPLATGPWGPFCPLPEPVEQVCKADPLPVRAPMMAQDNGSERVARRSAMPPSYPKVPPPGPRDDLGHPTDRTSPAPPVNPTSAEPSEASNATAWQQWAGVLLRMRDDLALFPPMPTDIWIGGVMVLLLVAGARVVRFRQLIGNAAPAPPDVCRMVADVSGCAGLRRAPEVWMVEGPLSPMVWCVLRPRLLLPVQLWADLDEVGRRAVVMHELAHLRRRDHWVLWIESAIGGLFWWHPLVWWVRRRLHLEADYCCDAWVTTLLPRTRRAYAEALLRTRQYVGENRTVIPAMGMGISSGRAKRFARRLTMVMTNTTKPGLSVWGVGLVLLVATTGWLASPARSCPDDKGEKHDCAKDHADCAKAADCPKAEAAGCGTTHGTAVVAPAARAQSGTSYERHLAQRAFGGTPTAASAPTPAPYAVQVAHPGVIAPAIAQTLGGWVTTAGEDEDDADNEEEAGEDEDEGEDGEDDAEEEDGKVEELEEQLEELGEQLEELARQLEETRASQDGRSDDGPRVRVREPRTPRPPRAPRAPMPGQPALPPMPGHEPHGLFVPGNFPKPGQTWADMTPGETEWRTYRLSEGKLDDFMALMSRQDVPVLVRAKDDAIEIQATPGQHRIFNAFFQIIDPSNERADAWRAQPFGALVGEGLGFGSGAGCGGDCSKCECEKCKEVKAHRKEAQKIRAEASQMANELRARAEGEASRTRAEARERAGEVRDRLRQEARKIRVEARNQEEIRRALEKESEALREQAERMREKADRARERAQQLRERSDENGEPQGAILEHIDVLERTADAMTEQGAEIEAKAEEVLAYVQTVQSDSEILDHHADQVDVRAETIDEIAGSVEHLEAGPELAMSIAQLARQIETAGGLANCDPSWISALSNLSAIEIAQPDVNAMKELAEMMRAAELGAATQQAQEAELRAAVEAQLLEEAAEAAAEDADHDHDDEENQDNE